MTVRRNLAFSLQLKKVDSTEIDRKVSEVSKMIGIDQLLERRPKTLSGGQQQRVALGRAMIRSPAVFLFDEPLSNLDANLRNVMRDEITKLHRSLNATMIYVTHDQTEAMTMADRIVVMNNGRIEQVGTPLEIYDNPIGVFVAGFIGTPAMNLFSGETSTYDGLQLVHADGFSLPLENWTIRWPGEKTEVRHSTRVHKAIACRGRRSVWAREGKVHRAPGVRDDN